MFVFYLYLMLHTCVQRFDVTENLEKFGILGATEQALGKSLHPHFVVRAGLGSDVKV
jgi:hypothetical protein